MRKITVPLSDLTVAIGHSYEIACYLDLEEQKVVEIFEEYESQLRSLVDNASQPLPDLAAIISYIRQNGDLADWVQDTLVETAQIRYPEDEGRFLLLPKLDSHTAYGYMETFIASLVSEVMQDLLYTAIDGRGAFSRFRRALTRYPDYRQQWFDFEEEQKGEFIKGWLVTNDLSLEA